MRVFTTRRFNRLDVAAGLADADLFAAATEMNDGLWDANLGGHVFKKRVALHGRGKRSGARTLVAFRSGDKAFFVYGFAKNQRTNISAKELRALKHLARELLAYKETQLKRAMEHGALIEIERNEND